MTKPPILIVVHPGSAVGSCDFHLGRQDGRAAREALVLELNAWRGGIYVIDSELSDELAIVPIFGNAIAGALARARAAGLLAGRAVGDDPEQVERTKELVRTLGCAAQATSFKVTGAWYYPDADAEGERGCVGSVVQALRDMGCEATVSEHAVVEVPDEPVQEPQETCR